jgi:hypothetical protein
MDAKTCVEILCRRPNCSHNPTSGEAASICGVCIPSADSQNSATTEGGGGDDSGLGEMAVLDLLALFSDLQSQRIQAYALYNSALEVLMTEGRIAEYSSLCAEMTARFSVISNTIIAVEGKLRKLQPSMTFADLIRKVQASEKEKLTLVASSHMEKIALAYPALKTHMGIEPQPEYISKRIEEVERQISEYIENIQIEKCDLE